MYFTNSFTCKNRRTLTTVCTQRTPLWRDNKSDALLLQLAMVSSKKNSLAADFRSRKNIV